MLRQSLLFRLLQLAVAATLWLNIGVLACADSLGEVPNDPDDMIHFCAAAILVSSYLNVDSKERQESAQEELSNWEGLVSDDSKMRDYAADLLFAFGSAEVKSVEIVEAAHNCIETRKGADDEE